MKYSDKLVVLGRKLEKKYANQTTSYTEDKTWIKAIDQLVNIRTNLFNSIQILSSDTNVNFSDLVHELHTIDYKILHCMTEITDRIGDLYEGVDPNIRPRQRRIIEEV